MQALLVAERAGLDIIHASIVSVVVIKGQMKCLHRSQTFDIIPANKK